MDNGLYTENAISTSQNTGRRFENLIFLHLRRKYKNIFYYRNKGECDFITMKKNAIKEAIQVCLTVNDENFEREYNGVLEAMKDLGIKHGSIVTINQKDCFKENDMTINMVPANEFLMQ